MAKKTLGHGDLLSPLLGFIAERDSELRADPRCRRPAVGGEARLLNDFVPGLDADEAFRELYALRAKASQRRPRRAARRRRP